MKVFTIAGVRNVCHGHGDFANEQQITMLGAYGMDGWPPVFFDRAKAEAWLAANSDRLSGRTQVVGLDLADAPPVLEAAKAWMDYCEEKRDDEPPFPEEFRPCKEQLLYNGHYRGAWLALEWILGLFAPSGPEES